MSRFYFDLVTPAGRDTDELGVQLSSLDEAYLEACRAAVEISHEHLLGGHGGDLHSYRFELFDDERNLLLEAPFREVLNPRAACPRPVGVVVEAIHRNLARSRELKAELAIQLEQARESAGRLARLLSDPGK
jgi:hypothetical protein